MASLQHRKSLEKRDSDEHTRSQDEKDAFDPEVSVSIADTGDEDEALKLVGRERAAQFTEEYNRKLRRKLVCMFKWVLMAAI